MQNEVHLKHFGMGYVKMHGFHYANMITCILYHGMKDLCLSFHLVQISNLWLKAAETLFIL